MDLSTLQLLLCPGAPNILTETGKLNASFPKWISKRDTELKKLLDLTAFLPEDATVAQRLYHVHINSKSVPVCPQCDCKLPFHSFSRGYRTYCSTSCRAKHTARTGVQHHMKDPAVKAKVARTNLERYGSTNYLASEEHKQRVAEGVTTPKDYSAIQAKMRETTRAKRGVDHPMQDSSVKARVKETNLQKYGTTCSVQSKDIQANIRKKRADEFVSAILQGSKLHIPLFSKEEYQGLVDEDGQVVYYKWRCTECSSEFDDYIANGKIPRCPVCYPPTNRGLVEREMIEWLRDEFPHLTFVSTRQLIQGASGKLEVDIYCEERDLAIELDELAWHGELGCRREGTGRGSQYHVFKTDALAERGIRLLHVWDIEWIEKRTIVKSIIRRYLGSYANTVYARKCEVRDVQTHEAREFLDRYHLQGFVGARVQKGLYYEGELLALISLSPNRFKRNTWEVVRYVVKADTNIPGGFSKALSKAEKHIPDGTQLVSYVDRRWYTGDSNLRAGFHLAATRKPSYHYTKDYKKLHNRMEFQKKKLRESLDQYEPSRTEWENMKLNGWDRVWDCGIYVYEKVVKH